jgi:hypothetical protein
MKKILAGLLMVPTMASAEFISGNELLSNLKGDTDERMFAIGYIAGVADFLDGMTVCSPTGVTLGQIRDLIRDYLEKNPDKRHYSADSLIRNKLERMWPCQQRGKGA